MAKRKSNKKKLQENSVRRSTGRPKRKCRQSPKNSVYAKVLRSGKVVNWIQQRNISYEGNNLKIEVRNQPPITANIGADNLPGPPLSTNNRLNVDEKQIQQNESYGKLPEYGKRVVKYTDNINLSICRNIIDVESNEKQDTIETPLPDNTLKTTESNNIQNLTHITTSEDKNNSKIKNCPVLDHITVIDEFNDLETNNKENKLQKEENNIFDMTTLRNDKTLNDIYQTIDVAESDSESDDVVLVNDSDEKDVTYINTRLNMNRDRSNEKTVIVIDDDSVMEISGTPKRATRLKNVNKSKDLNKFVLPSPIVNTRNIKSKKDEFIPQVTSTPARNANNEEFGPFNLLDDTASIEITQPLPAPAMPIRITTNVDIPSYSQSNPLAGTLRNQALQIQKQIFDTATRVGWNFLNANDIRVKGLRPIFIDGSNVAMGHVNGKYFSVKGLKICIDYFKMRGHEVVAIVPNYRKERSQNSDPRLFDRLEKDGSLIFTPSRKVYGRSIVPYDDRYIVQLAHVNKGIIVSADNYRDLLQENPDWLDTIKNRILTPTWLKDMIMFPIDPLGRCGPKLDEFLRFPD